MKTTLQILIAFYAASASAATLSLKSTNDYVFTYGLPTNADFRGIGTGENGIYSIPRIEDSAFLSEAYAERYLFVFSRDIIFSYPRPYALTWVEYVSTGEITNDYFKSDYHWTTRYVPDDFKFNDRVFRSESTNGWILASNDLTKTWKPLATENSRLYTTNDFRLVVDKRNPYYGRRDGQYTVTFTEITNNYHNLKLMSNLLDSEVRFTTIPGVKSSTSNFEKWFALSTEVKDYVVVKSGNYSNGYYSNYNLKWRGSSSEGDSRTTVRDPLEVGDMWGQYYYETMHERPVLSKPVSADEEGHWTYAISENPIYQSEDLYLTTVPHEEASGISLSFYTPPSEFKIDYPGSNDVDVALLFLFEMTDAVHKSNYYMFGNDYFGSYTNIYLPSQYCGVFLVTKAKRDSSGAFLTELSENNVYRAAVKMLDISDMSIDSPYNPVNLPQGYCFGRGGWSFIPATNRRIKSVFLRHFRAFAIVKPKFRVTFE